MGSWQTIRTDGKDWRIYVMSDANDFPTLGGYPIPCVPNVSSIGSSNDLSTSIAFANQILDNSILTDVSWQSYKNFAGGGYMNFYDEDDQFVNRLEIKPSSLVYVTRILNGSSCWDLENSGSYRSYQEVIDNYGLSKYCVGIKFRAIKMSSGSMYSYPHIIHIDDSVWMPSSSGWVSPDDLWRDNQYTGPIFGNYPDHNFYMNSSVFLIYDNGTTTKLYQFIYRAYNEDHPTITSGYYTYDHFGVAHNQLAEINITGAVLPEPEPEPEPEPTEEDGYVNELMNRFSPRYWAGSLGIYLIPTAQIADVMRAIMETDISDLLKNIFFGSDGKEYIISLKWYYGMQQIQNYGHYNGNIQMSADRKEIKCGSVALDLDEAPLYAHIASTEFATWTSSEIMVPEYFENYLDFMCSYQLYIPYYGFLELSPNDVVGGTLQLIYNINLVSGIADIVVVCKNSRSDNKRTKYYTVNAQIGIDIPYGSDMMKTSSANWAQTCGKAFVTGAKMGSFGATQEYMNFLGHNEAASNLLNDSSIELDEGLDRGALKKDLANEKTGASFKYAATQASNASDSLQNGVSSPSRSGSFSNESGSLDELHPYLLITRPVTAAPSDYEDYVGMPCSESVTLSNVTGFTQVAAVMPKTTYTGAPKYLPEIISQLQAGVYL